MKKTDAINILLELKHWEQSNLPLCAPTIGQCVIFRLIKAALLEEKLTIKQLTLDTPYSAAGIRLNLRQLEREGWISIVPHPSDQRIRTIEPSSKLTKAIDSYAAHALNTTPLHKKTAQ